MIISMQDGEKLSLEQIRALVYRIRSNLPVICQTVNRSLELPRRARRVGLPVTQLLGY